MNARRNRRRWRNFLIQPRFQLRLALLHVGFMFLVVAVLIVAVLSPLHQHLQGTDDVRLRYATGQLLLEMLDRVGIVVAVIIVVSAFYHVVFSHRLVGPLVNIGHTLDAIARGDLTRKVFLRRRDFLKKEAAGINVMLDALQERVRVLKARNRDMAAMVRDLPEGDVKRRMEAFFEENEALLARWLVSEIKEK